MNGYWSVQNMSVLEFYLGKSILGFNFPLLYLIFSTEFSTPHPDLKLILGHCNIFIPTPNWKVIIEHWHGETKMWAVGRKDAYSQVPSCHVNVWTHHAHRISCTRKEFHQTPSNFAMQPRCTPHPHSTAFAYQSFTFFIHLDLSIYNWLEVKVGIYL